MAATLVTKRPSSKLLKKLLSAVRITASSPSAGRSLSTSAQMRDVEEEGSSDVDRRSDQSAVSHRRGGEPFAGLFSDPFDPFYPTRSLSQVLNLMDQFLESPLAAAASRGMGKGGGLRRGWDVKEDGDGLYLRIDMPGLGKEDVKVFVEQDTLVIKGEGGEMEPDEGEEGVGAGRRYSSRIDLPPKVYKVDQIRAEMKNGVLKVLVPRVKEEERKDVVQVQID